MMPRTAHHTGAKARRGRDGVGISPCAGVVETRVYVLVDTRTPLQGDHELFMRPGDLPVASLFTTRSHEGDSCPVARVSDISTISGGRRCAVSSTPTGPRRCPSSGSPS